MRRQRTRALVAGAVTITACALAACSSTGSTTSSGSSASTASSSGASSTSSASTAATLKSQLPPQYQNGIQVGITNDTPPLIFENSSGQNEGLDLDLLAAMQKVLGVPLSVHSVPFADMLLGLESGKYAFVADTTINDTRKKTYDMMEYMTSSSSFGSLKSAPTVGTALTDVCGKTVGVVTGNNTVPYVTGTIDPACSAAGKPPVAMKQYPDFNTVYLNMTSGNVQMCFVDTMSYDYMMTQPSGSQFRSNGPQDLMKSLSGYSFLKNTNGALSEVVQKALTQMIADGEYGKLLAKWGESGTAITTPTMNPPSNS